MLVRSGVHLGPGTAASDSNRPGLRVDRDRVQQRKIGDDPVVHAAQAAAVVTTATHRERQIVRESEGNHGSDVARRRAPGDQRRPLVDHRVEQRAGLFVACGLRPDQLPSEPGAQLLSCGVCNSSRCAHDPSSNREILGLPSRPAEKV